WDEFRAREKGTSYTDRSKEKSRCARPDTGREVPDGQDGSGLSEEEQVKVEAIKAKYQAK
ncbi:MAG: hypothetical protein M3Y08_19670, partial [Fibrobacterota bacterium]|nr:hypothetical protein [Fibrobacterota bacterium]